MCDKDYIWNLDHKFKQWKGGLVPYPSVPAQQSCFDRIDNTTVTLYSNDINTLLLYTNINGFDFLKIFLF